MQKFGRLDNKRKKIQSNLSQASLDVASSVGSSDNEESEGNEMNNQQKMMPKKKSEKKLIPNSENDKIKKNDKKAL